MSEETVMTDNVSNCVFLLNSIWKVWKNPTVSFIFYNFETISAKILHIFFRTLRVTKHLMVKPHLMKTKQMPTRTIRSMNARSVERYLMLLIINLLIEWHIIFPHLFRLFHTSKCWLNTSKPILTNTSATFVRRWWNIRT